MEQTTRYNFLIRQGATVNPDVKLNGVSIHRGSSVTQNGISGPVDHFLMPGDGNVLEVDMRYADPLDPATHFDVSIRRIEDDSVIAALEWPGDFPALPPPAPPFPSIQLRTFSLPTDHPKPLFMSAPVERVQLEGTDETWKPVKELHAAMSRGDAVPIHDLFATRAQEFLRFHSLPDATPGGARAMIDAMMIGPYDLLPLDQGLVFREVAGGRGVQLIRLDDRPALAGICRTNPDYKYVSNPVLVRHEGAYRIVA